MNTFIHLEWNYKNPDADSNDMTTFGEPVRNVGRIFTLFRSQSQRKRRKRSNAIQNL